MHVYKIDLTSTISVGASDSAVGCKVVGLKDEGLSLSEPPEEGLGSGPVGAGTGAATGVVEVGVEGGREVGSTSNAANTFRK